MTWRTGIGLNDGDDCRKTCRLEAANVHGSRGGKTAQLRRENQSNGYVSRVNISRSNRQIKVKFLGLFCLFIFFPSMTYDL